MVAEAYVPAIVYRERTAGQFCGAAGKGNVRILFRIHQAKRGTYTADETHLRIRDGKRLNPGKSLFQHYSARDEFPQIPDPVSADIEPVHHHGPDAAVPDERKGGRHIGSIYPGNHQNRSADTCLPRSFQCIKCLSPGTGQTGKGFMDSGI